MSFNNLMIWIDDLDKNIRNKSLENKILLEFTSSDYNEIQKKYILSLDDNFEPFKVSKQNVKVFDLFEPQNVNFYLYRWAH